jgi:hypothetical protein
MRNDETPFELRKHDLSASLWARTIASTSGFFNVPSAPLARLFGRSPAGEGLGAVGVSVKSGACVGVGGVVATGAGFSTGATVAGGGGVGMDSTRRVYVH